MRYKKNIDLILNCFVCFQLFFFWRAKVQKNVYIKKINNDNPKKRGIFAKLFLHKLMLF